MAGPGTKAGISRDCAAAAYSFQPRCRRFETQGANPEARPEQNHPRPFDILYQAGGRAGADPAPLNLAETSKRVKNGPLSLQHACYSMRSSNRISPAAG
jgi:hypothetical protein